MYFVIILAPKGFPGGSEVKACACNAGDLGLIPGSGSSPGEGNGNPLQYSCLENPKDGGVWWAKVHGVAKSQTQLSDFTSLRFGSKWFILDHKRINLNLKEGQSTIQIVLFT